MCSLSWGALAYTPRDHSLVSPLWFPLLPVMRGDTWTRFLFRKKITNWSQQNPSIYLNSFRNKSRKGIIKLSASCTKSSGELSTLCSYRFELNNWKLPNAQGGSLCPFPSFLQWTFHIMQQTQPGTWTLHWPCPDFTSFTCSYLYMCSSRQLYHMCGFM